MKPTIRPMQPWDLDYLAHNLRKCDKLELMYATGQTTIETLKDSVELSDVVWVAESGGFPFAIFGFASTDDVGVGVPWMVATPQIYNNKLFVARMSIKYRDIFHEHFPVLVNYVYSKNTDTIKWLEWLGFSMSPSLPFGPSKQQFQQFMRVKDV